MGGFRPMGASGLRVTPEQQLAAVGPVESEEGLHYGWIYSKAD